MPSAHPHESEHGFTLTEIIVGAFVALIVLAGFVYFATSSSRTQSLASIRVRQTSVAKAVWERVNGTATWTVAPGCATEGATCTINPQVYRDAVADLDVQLDDLSIQASAVGRDIQADGIGDRNGAAPDVYDLRVIVSHATNQARKSSPVVLAGTFDPTKVGSAGALTVNVCVMLGQTDERIRVNSCTTTEHYGMQEPYGTSSTYGEELAAWEAIDDLESVDGVDASHMRSVTVTRPSIAGLQVSLAGPKDIDWVNVPASGSLRFTNLPPGLYDVKVRGYQDADLSRWEEGSTPVGSAVAIASGSDATSTVMLRNKGRRIHVGFDGSVTWTEDEVRARWVRLLPVPADRLSSTSWWRMDESDARAQGWMPMSELLDGDTMKLPPGLYSNAMLSQARGGPMEIVPVDIENDEPGEYIGDAVWIDPRGASYNLPKGDDALSVGFDGVRVLGEEGGA
jgi:hypothetical protein